MSLRCRYLAAAAALVLGFRAPAPAAAQTAAVGVGVPGPGEPSRFGTELSRGISAADLTRMAPELEYEVIPGDVYVFDIYHYGGTSGQAEHLNVQVRLEDDSTLQIPMVGPLSVKGLRFADLRKQALARLRTSVRLQHADVWMAAPALFTVFVTGAVAQPGSVVVNGLTRVSDAINQAGGALAGASWRRTVHTRGGVGAIADLLRWATGQDGTQNPLLRPGDAIHVPITQTGVQVQGRVRYPGLYELVEGETLQDLLTLAGGASPEADLHAVRVTRVAEEGVFTAYAVNVSGDEVFALRDGDVVALGSAAENSPMILVEGALFGAAQDPARPAEVPRAAITVQLPFAAGATLLGVLERLGGPTPFAEASRGYLMRASGERLPVDMDALWKSRAVNADVPLLPGDRIVVPIVPLNVVVMGEVRAPGAQPYTPGLTVSDYIRAAGGRLDGRGNLRAVRVQTRDGGARMGGLGDEVRPGETVVVPKQPIAAVGDFFSNNVFTITGIAVGILAVGTAVIDFVLKAGEL